MAVCADLVPLDNCVHEWRTNWWGWEMGATGWNRYGTVGVNHPIRVDRARDRASFEKYRFNRQHSLCKSFVRSELGSWYWYSQIWPKTNISYFKSFFLFPGRLTYLYLWKNKDRMNQLVCTLVLGEIRRIWNKWGSVFRFQEQHDQLFQFMRKP